jgi:hypothetical protein
MGGACMWVCGLYRRQPSRHANVAYYRYLNDATEGSLIKDFIVPILESEITELVPKLVAKGLIKGFYEFHGASGHGSLAEGFYRSLVGVVNKVSPLFILSFCRHEEGSQHFKHGLLSQWRAYGGSGGFALEFDEYGLDEVMKKETGKFAYGGFRSDDVRYDKYTEVFKSETYNGVAGEMMRKMFEPRDISAVTGRKNFDKVVIDFVAAAPFLKHDGFREEKEYRICAVAIRRSKIPAELKRYPKKIKFRSRNGLIVPYIELFKDFPKMLPLKSVIVGPHQFQERQADSIRLALDEFHFSDVQVRLSAIPYRL